MVHCDVSLTADRAEESRPKAGRAMHRRLRRRKALSYHAMLLPGVVLTFIFCYIPMFGLTMAFQNFVPSKGLFGDQTWVGWQNLTFLFSLPEIGRIFRNTLVLAVSKNVIGIILPVIIAIMMSELRHTGIRKGVQTIVYLPHFLSWVIIATMMTDMLSPVDGAVNRLLGVFGIDPVYFLGDPDIFPLTMIVSDQWKEAGYGSIVYLAAIMGIDTTLYEAAKMDGANKLRQVWHVTLPGMRGIVMLMVMLAIGNVLNGGFDQVYNLLNNQVKETGEILDTFIYELAFGRTRNYSLSAMAGLFKSVVSFVLISTGYFLSYKFANYQLF